jgi:uncharacterized RDD family membrane protein YckC
MNWYYLDNGTQRGPITEAEFPALFQIGVIGPETRLWREGMAEWKPYRELLGTGIPSSLAPAAQLAAPQPQLPEAAPQGPSTEVDRKIDCSQCDASTPASQIMRIGNASLCPKCQEGYRRQAQLGFGEKPLEYAKPSARLSAFLLDLLFCSAISVAMVIGGRFSGARFFPGNPAALDWIALGALLLSALWTLDYFIGRIAREGATPMMKRHKIKVVATHGAAVGFTQAFIRFICIGVTNILTLGLGHLLAFRNKKHRALHDLLSRTVVVRT